MANTYVAIATTTVGSGGASSVSFSSIPATYTDLLIKSSVRVAYSTVDGVVIQFNSDTNAANYSQRRLYGNGATAASDTSLTVSAMMGLATGSGYTASTFSNGEVYIPNYAGSAKKSFSTDAVTENNNTTSYNFLIAGLWNNTAAITDIVIKDEAGSTFSQYSTFTLYGIKNS